MKSTSIWLDTAHPEREPSLTRDTDADVCVIGAGIAGVTTAYLLAKEGRSVVLVDDGTPGCGQTGVTTAHLSDVIDNRYTEMIRLHGVDGARLACDSHRSAIARIESICRQEQIDAEFARVSGYLFLSPDHDVHRSQSDGRRQHLCREGRLGNGDDARHHRRHADLRPHFATRPARSTRCPQSVRISAALSPGTRPHRRGIVRATGRASTPPVGS